MERPDRSGSGCGRGAGLDAAACGRVAVDCAQDGQEGRRHDVFVDAHAETTSEKIAKDKKGLIEAFHRAILKANDYANKHLDEGLILGCQARTLSDSVEVTYDE